MKTLNANLPVLLLCIAQPAIGQGIDYTSRNYNTTHFCKSFAIDASKAANTYSRGVSLQDILETIDSSRIADSKNHRAFQAIQFVWKNQLDNSVLAHNLAMGLCLKPKRVMVPMDEPWITSPGTSKEFF